MKITNLLFGFIFCMIFCVLAYGTTETWARRDAFNRPQDFDNNLVNETWSGGEWTHEGVRGYYRFMLTQVKEDGPEKLFVQWVVKKNDIGVEEISYFISVREFNEFPVYDLTLPKCLNSDNCTKVSISATNIYENKTQTFILSLDGLGHYKFEI